MPDAHWLRTESLPTDFLSLDHSSGSVWLPLCLPHRGHSDGSKVAAHYYYIGMQDKSIQTERRLQDRTQAVLPVRVRGVDASGAAFEELAHTLDLTTLGVRLGSIRRPLKPLDTVIVFYRQRRMEFKVIWTKLLDGRSEYQVGLQVLSHAKEGWAVNLFGSSSEPQKQSHVAVGAL